MRNSYPSRTGLPFADQLWCPASCCTGGGQGAAAEHIRTRADGPRRRRVCQPRACGAHPLPVAPASGLRRRVRLRGGEGRGDTAVGAQPRQRQRGRCRCRRAATARPEQPRWAAGTSQPYSTLPPVPPNPTRGRRPELTLPFTTAGRRPIYCTLDAPGFRSSERVSPTCPQQPAGSEPAARPGSLS